MTVKINIKMLSEEKNSSRRTVIKEKKQIVVKKSVPAIKGIVKDPKISKTAKQAFHVLYGYTNKDNSICWPSIKTASEEYGITRNTLSKGINELIEFGYLEMQQTKFGDKWHRKYYLITTIEVEEVREQEIWNARSIEDPDQLMLSEDDQNITGNAQNNQGDAQKVPPKDYYKADNKGNGHPPTPSSDLKKAIKDMNCKSFLTFLKNCNLAKRKKALRIAQELSQQYKECNHTSNGWKQGTIPIYKQIQRKVELANEAAFCGKLAFTS